MCSKQSVNDCFSPHFYKGMFDRKQLANFADLEASLERVDFVYQHITQTDRISLISFIPRVKSDVLSYKVPLTDKMINNWESIKPINKALANAASNTLKAMIYAQRASTFFAMKLYKECISDVDRAIAHNYPPQDQILLLSLKEKAEDILNNDESISKHYYQEPPEIKKINAIVPSASQSVKIKREGRFGKHLVATQNIKVGEVIVVEKPFIAQLTEYDQPYCQECFELCYDLIPCDQCTYNFYCSEECKKFAWIKHHKFICPLLPTLDALNMLYAGRIMNLKLTLMNVVNECQKLGSYNSSSSETQYNSDTYKEIYNLTTNMEERSNSELIKEAYLASIILYLVENYTEFFKEIRGANKKLIERQIKRMLYLHQAICRTNHIAISELQSQSLAKISYKYRAIGLYAVGSLFNHSCSPNVSMHFHGTTLVARAIKPIKAGEQLFISYRCEYYRDTRVVRQTQLISEYDFLCQCIACKNNWPNWEFLKGELIDKRIEDKEYSGILTGDLEKSKIILPKLIEEYNKAYSEKREPCREIFVLQQLILFCYNNLGNCAFNRL